MQNHATHIHMLYLSPYIVTDWFCGTLFPFYFVIKRYEQTLRPGLCLSDSLMTVVHILTVGISLLDPYCLLRVQYCCYQFSCIVDDRVCGTLFQLLSPVQCFCCWCKFKLLCYAWVPPTIFSGIPFFGYIAHIQTTVHGTDFSHIFFSYINLCQVWHCLYCKPLCSLKHLLCSTGLLSFKLVFKFLIA